MIKFLNILSVLVYAFYTPYAPIFKFWTRLMHLNVFFFRVRNLSKRVVT